MPICNGGGGACGSPDLPPPSERRRREQRHDDETDDRLLRAPEESLLLVGSVLERRTYVRGSYKRRLLVLDLSDDGRGRLECYREPAASDKKKHKGNVAGKTPPIKGEGDADGGLSALGGAGGGHARVVASKLKALRLLGAGEPRWSLPSSANWRLRDVSNDDVQFEVLLPTGRAEADAIAEEESVTLVGDERASVAADAIESSMVSAPASTSQHPAESPCQKSARVSNFRIIHLKVLTNGNEKSIWLRAASELGRVDGPCVCTCPVERARRVVVSSRVRTAGGASVSALATRLDASGASLVDLCESPEGGPVQKHESSGTREYKVKPPRGYEHRWMTEDELRTDSLRPSKSWTDLRPEEPGPTVGSLRAEVLGCVGLPNMDVLSKTDAVAYLVCGPYAFATDVVNDQNNPAWPSGSRRAVIFPLKHAYARLFVGVFDDEGPAEDDQFVGRVMIEPARLRPGTYYDVTLPLRLYKDGYTRRARGAIRLRIRIDFTDERAALLSYLDWRPPPKGARGELSPVQTLQCGDLKAFRNVAITCQGAHLNGRYTKRIMKSAQREYKLYKATLKLVVNHYINNIMTWKNPLASLCVLSAWMHGVYAARLSLFLPYAFLGAAAILLQNYRACSLNEDVHQGFRPVTIPEMLRVLLFGDRNRGTKHLKPLEMKAPLSTAEAAADEGGVDDQAAPLLSKKASASERDGGYSANLDHAEFPFSQKEKYPKVTVLESMVKAKSRLKVVRKKKKTKNGEETASAADGEDDEDLDDENDEISIVETLPEREGEDGGGIEASAPQFVPSPLNSGSSTQAGDQAYWNFQKNKRPLAEQDLDKEAISYTTLQQDFEMGKEAIQNASLRLFDDRVYYVSEADILGSTDDMDEYESDFGPEIKEMANELAKMLGLRSYSNPVVKKMAGYMVPMIEFVKVGLNTVRAVFNLFMWSDPYLSFWALLFCVAAAGVLFVFPWRLLFFAVGAAAFGPQNWLARVRKERREANEHSESLALEKSKADVSGGEMGLDINPKEAPQASSPKSATFKAAAASSELAVSKSAPTDEKIPLSSTSKAAPGGEKSAEGRRYRFGDITRGIVARGAQSRTRKVRHLNNAPSRFVFRNHLVTGYGGLDEEKLDRYKFGDFTRGIVSTATRKKEKKADVRRVVVPCYSPLLNSRFYDWPPDPSCANVRANCVTESD